MAGRIFTGLSVCVLLLSLLGCGGGSSSTGAQGFYVGTDNAGDVFSTIILPHNEIFAIYESSTCCSAGMISGLGSSSNGTYRTATATNFSPSGTTAPVSLIASYVAGVSMDGSFEQQDQINNTYVENSTAVVFSGTTPAGFNYSTPAVLSSVTGSWSGYTMNGTTATLSIASDGTLSGTSGGCSFTGKVTPDTSGDNFFDVSLAFAGSPCSVPNLSLTGVGIATTNSASQPALLIGGVSGSNSVVFVLNQ